MIFFKNILALFIPFFLSAIYRVFIVAGYDTLLLVAFYYIASVLWILFFLRSGFCRDWILYVSFPLTLIPVYYYDLSYSPDYFPLSFTFLNTFVYVVPMLFLSFIGICIRDRKRRLSSAENDKNTENCSVGDPQ